MSLPASTLLLTFKSKIEEAVGLVPDMAAAEKLKAVQFWNVVSERLQDIVNNSAADINALAMKMAKDGTVEEIPLIDDQQVDDPGRCTDSPKDFIVSPSFVPANDYQVSPEHNPGDEGNNSTMDDITDFEAEPDLKNDHSKTVTSKTDIAENLDNYEVSLPGSPSVLASFSIEVSELSPCSKENLPLLKTDLKLSSCSKKMLKRKKSALTKMSKKIFDGKLKPKSRLKKKDVLEDGNQLETADKTNLLEEGGLIQGHDNQKTSDIVFIQSDCSNVLKAFKSPPYICEWCNTEFYSSSSLQSHQWTHVKPYSCAECSSRFSTKGNLIVHQRSHTGEKPFRCEQCDASFSTNSNLRRHAKTHTGEKPWECPQCEKRYTEKKSLHIHLRSHTGEKPYQCPICLKFFAQTGILQAHMALHMDQKAYLCEKCGKSFRQRSQLRLHKLRHEGVKKFSCEDCPADFLTKGDLERHKRVHTGERPFVCELCGKTYTRQQSLNEHMNRHYGLKPYECKYCNKKFAEMSACYKHIKVHERTKNSNNSDNKEEIQEQVEFQNIGPVVDEMTFEVSSDGIIRE